eukprot:jgi/Chrzof1/7397/Cz02g21370.t1
MSLSAVRITPEVFLACTTHALTHESEEVMGLLLGDIQVHGDVLTAHIWKAVPQIRTDRRKDRVETSPEQMAQCTAMAERLTTSTGVRTRVIGWYHSHPHITVLPSHVDVHTQAMYQMLETGFVGLIFSVFNSDAATSGQHIQVTAFQSVPQEAGLHMLGSGTLEGLDQQTKDALRASAAESAASAPQWMRKEVPLKVSSGPGSEHTSLHDYVDLQSMLLAEENNAYHSRVQPGPNQGAAAPAALSQLYESTLYQQALSQLMETELAPALQAMHRLTRQAEHWEQQLADQATILKGRLGALSVASQQQESVHGQACVL